METAYELIAENIEDRDERMKRVADWLYENAAAGRQLTNEERDAISDYVLREELADNHPDKITREEYPFMSTSQLNRRRMRETSVKAAMYYDTDRIDRRPPRRRKRSKYENIYVDQYAKSRNLRRRRAYNAFVAGRDWYEYEGKRVPIEFILRAVPIKG